MELNLVLPWGCLSYRLLLRNVALDPSESYSSCCCSGNICWWDGEMFYLVLYFYFLLVTCHYTFSWYFSTYSSYQPTVATGYSGLYLLFMGWMKWNLLVCANQQIVQSSCQGGVVEVLVSELLSDWLLGQTPVITVNPTCRKYKITAESSHERYQKHV